MPIRLPTLSAYTEHGFDTLIDVRSPSEYAEDHVPGAISLPVFSDAERAEVGTIYVRDSPFRARKIGAAILARNAAAHIEGALAEKDGGWRPLVCCWRGGQRSGAFASILSQIGWRADTIEGGYQSYRRAVVALLYDTDIAPPVVLLDGNTGTAKTDILHALAARGVQTLDLEGLANHRGSVLGGQGKQPSQKAFETELAQALLPLDPARPLVVEAESSRIGALNLPPRLFAAMKAAPRIEIRAPLDARARYLTRAYADMVADRDILVDRLRRLVRLQGHERVDGWIADAEAGRFEELASVLMQHHYDPRYTKARTRPDGVAPTVLESDTLTPEAVSVLAARIEEILDGGVIP